MPLPDLRSDLIHRPGEGTSLRKGWCRALPEILICPLQAAMRTQPLAFSAMNLLASASMRCRMTASFRASATFVLHPGTLGELHRPALEPAALDRSRQDDIGGFIEWSAIARS